MRATSSNSLPRVMNAAPSSAARSSMPLPARSASPPSSLTLTDLLERRERQDLELLESLLNRREAINRQIEALCHEQDYIDREVRKLRENLPSQAQEVITQEAIVINDDEEEYDESDSEPPAKPVERRANNKKRPHAVFDEDEEVEDNSQGAPKRRQVDQIPLEVDYDNLTYRQKLALLLNSFGTEANVLTSEILRKYQQKFDASAKWENLRQAITKLRSEGYIKWNENTSSNSRYRILKRIPM